MKYVRTKDGRIFKVDDRTVDFVPCTIGEEVEGEIGVYRAVEVIAQAETIEELCDYLIIKYKGHEPQIQKCSELVKCMKLNNVGWNEHFKWLKEKYKDNLEYAKLAILTEWGLKFVAKINEEGELDLL